jgi:hypothetical protein
MKRRRREPDEYEVDSGIGQKKEQSTADTDRFVESLEGFGGMDPIHAVKGDPFAGSDSFAAHHHE